MTRLLLTRHGRTAWNAERRYQGHTDIPLNAEGRHQVQRLAERLRSETIDAMYVSDLRRAWETAEAIAAPHDLSIRPEPRLREICFGRWEGKTHEQIKQHDAESLARWFDDPMHASPPGGETLAQAASRVGAAYDDILERHPEETVALVAHGGTLRLLLCLGLGVPPEDYWHFRFDVASLSELNTYDGGVILNSLNETAHLDPQQEQSSPAAAETTPRHGGSHPNLILVLGGARSGKSDYAQQRMQELCEHDGSVQSPVLFVATAEPGDAEMEQRIEEHRRARPAHWHTLEAARNVGQAILDLTDDQSFDAILVDCMTLLASNLLVDAEDPFAEEIEAELMREVGGLLTCAERLDVPIVVVSNEVGWGLVPPYPVGRAYRDLLGRANQVLAEAADEVILLVAGIPKVIKDEG